MTPLEQTIMWLAFKWVFIALLIGTIGICVLLIIVAEMTDEGEDDEP